MQVSILNYPLALALLVIGMALPSLSALAVSAMFFILVRQVVSKFQFGRLQYEIAARTLLDMKREEEKSFEIRYRERQMNETILLNVFSQTNFFYLLDHGIGDPDSQQSLQVLIFCFVDKMSPHALLSTSTVFPFN